MEKNQQNIIIGIVAVVAIIAIVLLLQHPRDDSLGARLDNAMEKVSEGVKDAGKELKPESQKTFGEKVGDAVEDAGKNIKGSK